MQKWELREEDFAVRSGKSSPRETFPWEFEQYRCLLIVRDVGQSRGRRGDEVCAGNPLGAINKYHLSQLALGQGSRRDSSVPR